LRASFAARSRFAEDELGEAYRRDVRQYVVLGARIGEMMQIAKAVAI
jgi:hypothetical protein